jgi:hypothetical protein
MLLAFKVTQSQNFSKFAKFVKFSKIHVSNAKFIVKSYFDNILTLSALLFEIKSLLSTLVLKKIKNVHFHTTLLIESKYCCHR